MTMLLLTLTFLRAQSPGSDLIDAVRHGQMQDVVRAASGRLARDVSMAAEQRAAFGQVIGRSLIALGREEQADELFQKQLRLYEAISRPMVRWLSCLDRGVMFLNLNKMARAAESFGVAAEDLTAPAEIRAEALAGLSQALLGVGEHRRAARTLQLAIDLAEASMPPLASQVLHAMRLEMAVLADLRSFDDGRGGVDHGGPGDGVPLLELCAQLARHAEALESIPIAAQRMRFVAALLNRKGAPVEGVAPILDGLRWLRDRRLAGAEDHARIEAALVFVAHGDERQAMDTLGPLATDELQIHRHRYAVELKYCLSRLYAMNGRHIEALRMYREHATQAMARLRTDLAHLPYSHMLEKREMAEHGDATQLQLPVRYRKAYHFIIENLDDRELSIKRVAAHIDVTERALQMAFRSYIGMTPAELIRRRRMERIRTELHESSQHVGVLEVASRWGMTIRSTLAQNYRQHFDETPTSVRRAIAA